MKKIRPEPVDFAQVARFLAGAAKKLLAAKKMIDIDEEASYQLAYEAMLKASLGFMLTHGMRPRGLPGHHIVIIEFAGKHLGQESQGLVALFNRMRRKRNQALYDVSGIISRQEAEQALETAEKYLGVIREEIQERNPQARLF